MSRVGLALLVALVVVIFGYSAAQVLSDDAPAQCMRSPLPVVVNLDDVRHARILAHEREAIERGQPRQLTLERDGAPARRREDLRGIATILGHDRDEYPPAVAEESGLHSDGTRADVAPVPSSENRSGGATLGLQLRPYCDGQRFIIEAGKP